MNQDKIKQLMNILCDCPCHRKGDNFNTMCFPCCDDAGLKYINDDGSIDWHLFASINPVHDNQYSVEINEICKIIRGIK